MRSVAVTGQAGEKRLSIVECEPPLSTSSDVNAAKLSAVIPSHWGERLPAKAGIHAELMTTRPMDSRLRGNDDSSVYGQKGLNLAALSSDVTVAVRAFSLNNGEIRVALEAQAGYRPGWDFAGVVESAPSGSPFTEGDRVVGLKYEGAWAERIVVPPGFLAALPDDVSFEAASTLPVAGLTALLALSKKPVTHGQKVLVTAATGGVGMFAIQLAALAGAHVTAYLRDEVDAPSLLSLGADSIAIGEDAAARQGPYDLILDGVGGRLLGRLLQCLCPRGVCVQFGDAGGEELTTFDAKSFRLGAGGAFGGTSLYGFFLIEELGREECGGAGPLLDKLVLLLRAGSLNPVIDRTQSWNDIDEVARALLNRHFKGKAVLRID